jgi:hypothetical protein
VPPRTTARKGKIGKNRLRRGKKLRKSQERGVEDEAKLTTSRMCLHTPSLDEGEERKRVTGSYRKMRGNE